MKNTDLIVIKSYKKKIQYDDKGISCELNKIEKEKVNSTPMTSSIKVPKIKLFQEKNLQKTKNSTLKIANTSQINFNITQSKETNNANVRNSRINLIDKNEKERKRNLSGLNLYRTFHPKLKKINITFGDYKKNEEKTKIIIIKKIIKPNKLNLNKSVIKGYYGRKQKDNMPLIYDKEINHYFQYKNKSEKERHQILLNEFNKIKEYMLRNPGNEKDILKELLIKYNIKNVEENSKSFLSFFNLINDNNSSDILNYIKLNQSIKYILNYILKNSDKISKKISDNFLNNKKLNGLIDYNNSFILNYKERNNSCENIPRKKTLYYSYLNKHSTKKIKIEKRASLPSLNRCFNNDFNLMINDLCRDSLNSDKFQINRNKRNFYKNKTMSDICKINSSDSEEI